MKRGKLIVIEGTDCSGKGTQTNLLVNRLESENIHTIKYGFPRYNSPTGNVVGICYLGKSPKELSNPYINLSDIPTVGSWFGNNPDKIDPLVASLYYAADRKAHNQEIKNYLENNINVICDRYVESNMGHQGGKIKDKNQREEFFRTLEKLEYGVCQLHKPDGIIFLYMPYQRGMELKKGREGIADLHEASPDHLKDAEESYLHLSKLYNWIQIDCDPDRNSKMPLSKEIIHEQVYQKALKIINED